MSKKQRRMLSRLKIAELKQVCQRPDVVEVWDVTAADPELLVFLKVGAGRAAGRVCVSVLQQAGGSAALHLLLLCGRLCMRQRRSHDCAKGFCMAVTRQGLSTRAR